MNASQMVVGPRYRLKDGRVVEFSRFSFDTGVAIVHPPGEVDMQSCFGISLYEEVVSEQPELDKSMIVWVGNVFHDGQVRRGRAVRKADGVLICEVVIGVDSMGAPMWRMATQPFSEFLMEVGRMLAEMVIKETPR